MSDDSERPIIIKKKKVVAGGMATMAAPGKWPMRTFVTAMMAFFMLMWLLNATTEQQRIRSGRLLQPVDPESPETLAAAMAPSAAMTFFPKNTIAQEGNGATDARPTEGRQNLGTIGSDYTADDRRGTRRCLWKPSARRWRKPVATAPWLSLILGHMSRRA